MQRLFFLISLFASTTSANDLPLRHLQSFTDAMEKIKQHYVEEVSEDRLWDAAIRGMTSDLDPHSTYFNHDEARRFNEVVSGQYAGIGIQVNAIESQFRITGVTADGPASRAGIRVDDVLTRIDDFSLTDATMQHVIEHLRGEPTTKVAVHIQRGTEAQTLRFDLLREMIQVKSVQTYLIENGTGYIRLQQFQQNSAQEVLEAVSELRRQSAGKLNGLVLDLRDNPGGLLQSAVQIADAFIRKGTLLSTRHRNGEYTASATADDVLNGAPMVLLINQNSASSAEIVAGALQDHKRAVLVGSQSYGKGSVQTRFELPNEAAIKITTARYYTPSGRSIQATGITPDIVVPDGTISAQINNAKSEKDLPRYLKQEDMAVNSTATRLPLDDAALASAISVLKGLMVVKK